MQGKSPDSALMRNISLLAELISEYLPKDLHSIGKPLYFTLFKAHVAGLQPT
jgi:hypothetical protein